MPGTQANGDPGIGILRQQARMVLGDMEDDRACLEQGEIAFTASAAAWGMAHA
jgi:hypothetical protein